MRITILTVVELGTTASTTSAAYAIDPQYWSIYKGRRAQKLHVKCAMKGLCERGIGGKQEMDTWLNHQDVNASHEAAPRKEPLGDHAPMADDSDKLPDLPDFMASHSKSTYIVH